MGEDYDDEDEYSSYDDSSSGMRYDDSDEESPKWKGRQKFILGSLMAVLALIGIVVTTQMVFSFARAPEKSAQARGVGRSEEETPVPPEETSLPARTPATHRRPPPSSTRTMSPSPKARPPRKKKNRRDATPTTTSATSQAQHATTTAAVVTNEGETPTEDNAGAAGESKPKRQGRSRGANEGDSSAKDKTGATKGLKFKKRRRNHGVTPGKHPSAKKTQSKAPTKSTKSAEVVSNADNEDPYTINDFRN